MKLVRIVFQAFVCQMYLGRMVDPTRCAVQVTLLCLLEGNKTRAYSRYTKHDVLPFASLCM